MTWEYRVKKAEEFHHPVSTAVPADFEGAKIYLKQHLKRLLDVENIILFYKSSRAVDTGNFIEAGPSQFYKAILLRDINTFKIYAAGMSRKHRKAIRNHR
ncbi:hypothetical protein BKM13_25210 [Pseudomonas syringae pv. syringae]|nr:hypothetical protein BKM13_25210 [Pseudomonas syringae pv. syringae]